MGLVRKLNGAPTAQEMRLERAESDAGFPTAKTYRRFGSKNDLIGKVLDYCRERPEDEDVVQLLESVHVWSIVNRLVSPGMWPA